MVVCKFFQQGSCRYGQNCKFEHIYGSKYSYQAPVQQSGVSDEQLVNQVQTDVQSALQGGQWLLSCYAPIKEKPVFPGIQDLSPEEARLFIYEAKANNNVDQAVTYMNNIFKEYRQKYEQLLQPNPAIIKVLRSLYKGEITSSPFTSANSAASSVFRSAVQNTGFNQNNPASSMFGQNSNNNVFGLQQADPKTVFGLQQADPKNVFGLQQADPKNVFGLQQADPKNVFANASQNVFGQNGALNVFAKDNGAKSIFAQANQSAFAPSQTDQSSIFANTNQSATNIFASANQSFFAAKEVAPNTSPFSQNVFQRSESQPSNIFSHNVLHNAIDDSGMYSKMEDLSAEELQEFNNDSFRLGFIPEAAPPQTLCN